MVNVLAQFMTAPRILGGCRRYLLAGVLFCLGGCGGSDDEVPPRSIPKEIEVSDLQGHRTRLVRELGQEATLILAWSLRCPCVQSCTEVIQTQLKSELADGRVRWLAIACEPTDPVRSVRTKVILFKPPYDLYIDVDQKARRFFGFERASQVAVVDGAGQVRYWGTLSDALEKPTEFPAVEAVKSLLRGEEPAVAHHDAGYGCPLSKPRD